MFVVITEINRYEITTHPNRPSSTTWTKNPKPKLKYPKSKQITHYSKWVSWGSINFDTSLLWPVSVFNYNVFIWFKWSLLENFTSKPKITKMA